MKELYKSISDILLDDSDLKNMCSYTDDTLNIRRGYVPTDTNMKWNTLVVYYFQTEVVIPDFNSQIRNIPLIVRVYDRKSDLTCDDIAERVILLLCGADLSVSGKVFVYDCDYTGEMIPSSWNNDQKSYEKVLRFTILARQDEVVGSSGRPTTNRKRTIT